MIKTKKNCVLNLQFSRNSMNNLSSYYASDKDLPVKTFLAKTQPHNLVKKFIQQITCYSKIWSKSVGSDKKHLSLFKMHQLTKRLTAVKIRCGFYAHQTIGCLCCCSQAESSLMYNTMEPKYLQSCITYVFFRSYQMRLPKRPSMSFYISQFYPDFIEIVSK